VWAGAGTQGSFDSLCSLRMTKKAEEKMGKNDAAQQLSPLQVTLRANLLFWGVLVLAGILAFLVCGAVWDDAVKGLEKFLFLVLGGVFTLVSVMDHFYERQAGH